MRMKSAIPLLASAVSKLELPLSTLTSQSAFSRAVVQRVGERRAANAGDDATAPAARLFDLKLNVALTCGYWGTKRIDHFVRSIANS